MTLPTATVIDERFEILETIGRGGFGVVYKARQLKLDRLVAALGTCHYMAPEQALGGQVDQRADIYACGCLFYEMVAGKKPFDADDNIAVMYKHLNEDAPLIEEMKAPDAAFAEAVRRVIDNCLIKDPQKRYQTADEVLTDLRSIGSKHSVILRAVRKNKAKRAGRMKVATLAAATAGILALLLAISFQFLDQRSQQSMPVMNSRECLRLAQKEFYDSYEKAPYERESHDESLRLYKLSKRQ